MVDLPDDEIFITVTNGIVKTLIQEGVASVEYIFSGPFELQEQLKSSSPNALWVSAADPVIELEHPLSESICLELLTQQPELVVDGRVTVLRGGLNELPAWQYSFVLIIMVEVTELDKESRGLAGGLGQVMSGKSRTRLSEEALRCGASLSVMGRYILSELKKETDKIRAAEVLFVVSDREIIERFRPVANGYAERARLRYRNKA